MEPLLEAVIALAKAPSREAFAEKFPILTKILLQKKPVEKPVEAPRVVQKAKPGFMEPRAFAMWLHQNDMLADSVLEQWKAMERQSPCKIRVPPKAEAKPRGDFSVWVGQVDYNVTEDQLKNHFAGCGNVVSCTIAKDKDTGNPRGHGYVGFGEDGARAVEEALKLDGSELGGRNIQVARVKGKGGPPRN